jgi:hypothetical protein
MQWVPNDILVVIFMPLRIVALVQLWYGSSNVCSSEYVGDSW